MIRIGITQRQVIDPHYGELRDALDRRWHLFATLCDIVLTPLPNDPVLAVQSAKTNECIGLILSGGDNLTLDGGSLSSREHTETALFNWATEHHLPIMGICRGMQRLAILAGSTIVKLEGHVATRHQITTNSGRREINSFHNFGLIEAPPNYEIVAQAGISIESIRHFSQPIEGIMWHPERETIFHESDIKRFKRLFHG